MASNFVIISGGPGLYEPCDPENHDTGWSNYVDNVLLLQRANKLPMNSGESLWWFLYKPAYEARWNDDVAKSRTAVNDIKKKGSTSYVDHLEKRAIQYKWNLRWLITGSEFWAKLQTFRDPINRVWYFGHARDDLWLYVNHNGCQAVSPPNAAIIRYSDMASRSSLKSRFRPGGPSYDEKYSSRFYGCNTAKFALTFAKAFGVYAEGAEGKTTFEGVHSSGGDLRSVLTGCTWKKFNTLGIPI
jgi:hypothetical protein